MCDFPKTASKIVILLAVLFSVTIAKSAYAEPPSSPQERMVEWTIESQKQYSDPFNDVEVDVIFTRGDHSIVSVTDGIHTYTSRIVPVDNMLTGAGAVGLLHENDGTTQSYSHFEIRESAQPFSEPSQQIDLVVANGVFRGKLNGAGWDDYGKKEKQVLLNAYLPEPPPYSRDWLLVLEAQ